MGMKNRLQNKLQTVPRTGLIPLFIIMVMVGFGVPYVSAGYTAAAASGLGSASTNQTTADSAPSTYYGYKKLSTRDVYPYYIASSFVVAGGLSLYALSYLPGRIRRESRYASRYATLVRTTY